MNTYKARIKINGRLLTPLRADTIFGHVAWGIARHEGAESLEAFLDSFATFPPLVMSSAFPAGCIPVPQLYNDLANPSDPNAYSRLKKSKRLRYIPISTINNGNPINHDVVGEAASSLLYEETRVQTLHNTVDRLRGGTLEEVGLFQTRDTWLYRIDPREGIKRPAFLDIYIASDMDVERIDTLIRWAFESGFGAKSSSGAGWVELQGIEAFSLPNKGNRAMALAPFVLENPAEVDNLKADIFVRHGMLAQEFGAYMNPFKKPILFFDEGSTFVPKHEKCFIGSMVKDIHRDRRIRQHGLAPILWLEGGGAPPISRSV